MTSKIKIGDRKYYIPGYRGDGLLAILVTIRDIDGDGYFWVDEPVGHSIEADMLMYQDEAAMELLDRYEDEKEVEGYDVACDAQLSAYRAQQITYINESRKGAECEPADFSFLKDKKPWEEWFNPQMIFDKRKGYIRAAAVRCPKGKVYWTEAPGRHNHAMAVAQVADPSLRHFDDQGFILQDETYVDRATAAKLAIEHGQIEKTKWGDILYSEDLW